MKEVVIVDAVRTPIGHYKGALKSVRPDDLGAIWTWYNKLDIKIRENGEFIMPSPLRCEEMPNQKILNYKIRLDYSR